MTYKFFAQPIQHLITHQTILYELLLRQWDATAQRWQRPDTFELPADTVIYLLDTAIADLANSRVSINLTCQQFASTTLLHQLTTYIHNHLEPRQLTIELVAPPTLPVLQSVGAVYRATGTLIAFDDVGSDNHFATINHLLPYVNTLKFALQNMRTTTDQPLPPAILSNLKFWATKAAEEQLLFTLEGIETPNDITLAKQLGVYRGQGYYFSQPQIPQHFNQAQ